MCLVCRFRERNLIPAVAFLSLAVSSNLIFLPVHSLVFSWFFFLFFFTRINAFAIKTVYGPG